MPTLEMLDPSFAAHSKYPKALKEYDRESEDDNRKHRAIYIPIIGLNR